MSTDEVTDLQELFARDPLKLTDNDLSVMLDGLRTQRHIWINEEGAARTAGRKPASRVTTGAKPKPAAQPTLLEDGTETL